MSYIAPVKDMLFNMQHLAALDEIAKIPGFEEAGMETAQAVLEECARFNQDVVAPLNWEGDKNPSSWKAGVVTTTPGFKQAYKQYAEGGWQGLQHPADFGGQGLPKTIGAACIEMLNAANMSFALCPLLTDGAIEALLTAGSDELKATYLDKLVSGEWTGTMNLTEPQAGSDLSMVRSRAEPQADGTYKVFGTKIYITYGEHDMADNIVHLVLARVTGAPEGVKGISLFVVPKFNVKADGTMGERNGIYCGGLEHKMGIHGNATAQIVLDGAVGTLVEIVDFAAPQAGLLEIRCSGTQRFRMKSYEQLKHGLWTAQVELLAPDLAVKIPADLQPAAQLLQNLIDTLQNREVPHPEMPFEPPYLLDDCGWVANRWCELISLPLEVKQRLMALDNPLLRLELVGDMLERNGITPG